MSIEETRARLAQRIRQALDQSDIAFSTAQRGKLDQLVDDITDNVLVEYDALLGNMMRSGQLPGAAARPAPAPTASSSALPPIGAGQPSGIAIPEEVLWEGRPFLSIGELYVVTTERVRMLTGVIGRETEDIELIRIQDLDHHQGVGERIINIGDITLHTTDKSQPDVTLHNVTDPAKVHEIIRRAILDVRRRYPFAFRQEI